MRRERRRRRWAHRLAGWAWALGWGSVLYAVAAPWRGFGGVVDERVRWLEWFLLWCGLVLGFTAGGIARDLVKSVTVRTYIGVLRVALYPLALLTAAGAVTLSCRGNGDLTVVALTTFLAYWAGLDLAYAILPLVRDDRAEP